MSSGAKSDATNGYELPTPHLSNSTCHIQSVTATSSQSPVLQPQTSYVTISPSVDIYVAWGEDPVAAPPDGTPQASNGWYLAAGVTQDLGINSQQQTGVPQKIAFIIVGATPGTVRYAEGGF